VGELPSIPARTRSGPDLAPAVAAVSTARSGGGLLRDGRRVASTSSRVTAAGPSTPTCVPPSMARDRHRHVPPPGGGQYTRSRGRRGGRAPRSGARPSCRPRPLLPRLLQPRPAPSRLVGQTSHTATTSTPGTPRRSRRRLRPLPPQRQGERTLSRRSRASHHPSRGRRGGWRSRGGRRRARRRAPVAVRRTSRGEKGRRRHRPSGGPPAWWPSLTRPRLYRKRSVSSRAPPA